MLKTHLLPQEAFELEVGDRKRELSRSYLERFYLSLYVWLLYVVFNFNGIAIVYSFLVVIGNCPYFE